MVLPRFLAMESSSQNDSFLITDPRNDTELRENELIKEAFGVMAGNVRLQISVGNLISHYRKTYSKLLKTTRDVASLLPEP